MPSSGVTTDLRILEATQDTWLNVVHLHGDNVYFDAVADYPVQVWNWHDRETGPSLADGLKKITGAACGGIARDSVMLCGQPAAVRQQVTDAIAQTNGRRYHRGHGLRDDDPHAGGEYPHRDRVRGARLSAFK